MEAVAAQQAGKDVGGQHHLTAGDDRAVGVHPQRRPAGDELPCGGVFVHVHAGLDAGAGEFQRQLGRVDDRARVRAEEPRQIRWRVHLGADLSFVERPTLALPGRLLEPLDLVRFGGHGEHPGALPVDLQAEFVDLGLHAVEILHPHVLEGVDLVGPAGFSVLVAVGQAGVDESAVAPRGGPADPVGLDEHDAAIRVAARRVQRAPQAGVSPADHEQVACRRTGCRGMLRTVGVQPHGSQCGSSQRTVDQGCVDLGVEHRLHDPHITA